MIDLALQRVDAGADAPAVRLELGLARAARADAAAEARERGARSGEPRQQVLELRQLDLPLSFPRTCTAREDVEDQLRAIEDLALQLVLEMTQLGGRELVVADHHVDVGLGARRRKALHLAAPDERGRVGPLAVLHGGEHDGGAGRFGQPLQLRQRHVNVRAARRSGHHADERGALDSGR